MTDEESPEDRVAALERRLAEMEEAHRSALLRSALRSAAVRAGMVDLDGLKLVDTSGVTVDENGDVVGVAPLLTALRRAKPWLFGLARGTASTSAALAAPPADPPKPRRATDMTYEEWQAARAELLRRT